MAIDFEQFIHPMDRSALNALKKIPLLDTLLKKYMSAIDEDMLHNMQMVSMVRISSRQLPELHEMLQETCIRLDIPEPDFYLEMNPIPNAYTYGDTRPFVVINSGLLDILEKDEIKAVIAHECGHILCHHVLYGSLAKIIINVGAGFLGEFKNLALAPLRWGLQYWVRRSEFSADRVYALVMGEASIVVNVMMRLAGGRSEITKKINIPEFLQQALEYRKKIDESKFSKLLQNWAIKDMSHPFAAIRAIEVLEWFNLTQSQLPQASEYDQLFKSIKLKD